MKKIFYIIISALTALLIQSCAETDINSFTNQAYKNYKIRTIALSSEGFFIPEQKKLEQLVKKALFKKGINAYTSEEIWPPTKKYEKKELFKRALKKDVDAILKINLISREKQSTSYQQGYVAKDYYGGSKTTDATLAVKLTLIDPRKDENIWVADADSTSFDIESILESIAEESVSLLKKDRLI